MNQTPGVLAYSGPALAPRYAKINDNVVIPDTGLLVAFVLESSVSVGLQTEARYLMRHA